MVAKVRVSELERSVGDVVVESSTASDKGEKHAPTENVLGKMTHNTVTECSVVFVVGLSFVGSAVFNTSSRDSGANAVV